MREVERHSFVWRFHPSNLQRTGEGTIQAAYLCLFPDQNNLQHQWGLHHDWKYQSYASELFGYPAEQ